MKRDTQKNLCQHVKLLFVARLLAGGGRIAGGGLGGEADFAGDVPLAGFDGIGDIGALALGFPFGDDLALGLLTGAALLAAFAAAIRSWHHFRTTCTRRTLPPNRGDVKLFVKPS